jgi:hypothetical protein
MIETQLMITLGLTERFSVSTGYKIHAQKFKIFFLVVLWFELWASCLVGRRSAT